MKTMESKRLVLKLLMTSGAYSSAYCTLPILWFALHGRMTPRIGFWICAILAIVNIPLMGSVLARGLIAGATHTEPTVPGPATLELRVKTKTLRRKMNVLASLMFVLCITGGVLLDKYHMTAVALSLVGINLFLLLPFLNATNRLKSLQTSAKALAPAPEIPLPERSDKGQIYAISIALMTLSILPAVVLPVCIYFIVVGARTSLLYCVLAAAVAALASLPFFSGVIVRKLGLPTYIEIS